MIASAIGASLYVLIQSNVLALESAYSVTLTFDEINMCGSTLSEGNASSQPTNTLGLNWI